jgi:hypothetical protein
MPCEFVALLVACAPLFSQPVFQHTQVLLMGAILAPGKRTVTAALRVMGLSQDAPFQHDHRVLHRALWAGLTTSQVLLGLLVSACASTGTSILSPSVGQSGAEWLAGVCGPSPHTSMPGSARRPAAGLLPAGRTASRRAQGGGGVQWPPPPCGCIPDGTVAK